MKYPIKIISIALLCSALITSPKKSRAQEFPVSLQVFYDQLSPYGQWVDYPQYGYAWIPSLDETFMPYATDGHWILTDYGWTWVSDYDWGWAAFHYGRWQYDPYYGWIWMPDTMWAPAWVAWGQSSGYYGWAPLGPGINVSASSASYNIPAEQWVFVRSDDMVRPDVNRYYVNRSENVTIIKNTTLIKNIYVDKSRNVTYITGPDKNEVQKVTGKPVKAVAIEESNKPGQKLNNDKLVIYKPEVQKAENNSNKPAPARVVALEVVKKPELQQRRANAPAGNNNQAGQQQQKNNQNVNHLDSANNIFNQQKNKKVNPQPERKPPNVNPVNNKPQQQQVKPRPNPQNIPEQKPKPKPVPPKPQPQKPQT